MYSRDESSVVKRAHCLCCLPVLQVPYLGGGLRPPSLGVFQAETSWEVHHRTSSYIHQLYFAGDEFWPRRRFLAAPMPAAAAAAVAVAAVAAAAATAAAAWVRRRRAAAWRAGCSPRRQLPCAWVR
eukprot:CAMPEP_0179962136 /NCGR_PEP_ID=MMETSP0983-20121128/30070_1 /TAXON_ID=483367 /ORGANISM="non described non described, Strain CCMP 2436" /LENGTH=125 /DNA_ID=CAMNT_0021874647 /DNA_START=592 /DNA_END=966 /DNA_ORIENTATION=-